MDYLKKAVNAPERLIDGNELMEWLKGKIRECVVLNAHSEAATTEEIIRHVKHMQAVDAVPVVRCKDCEYSYYARNRVPSERATVCDLDGRDVPLDWYCAAGKLRDSIKSEAIYTHNNAAMIVELFEDILEKYDIKVPSPEDDQRDPDNDAKLYGSVYSDLLDDVESILIDLLGTANRGSTVVPFVFGEGG